MTTQAHPSLGKTVERVLGDEHSRITLIDTMSQDSALKIVNAARISYDKSKEAFTEKDKKLARYLWDHEHTSPYRHTFYTFAVEAPLFTFRQWVKYQVGATWRTYEVDGEEVPFEIFDQYFDTDKGCSWNEQSGRYAEFQPVFYKPLSVRVQAPKGSKQKSVETSDTQLTKQFTDTIDLANQDLFKRYQYMLSLGIAKEDARILLPQTIYTKACWTVSLQGVLHFLTQRLHHDSQWAIQKYAQGIQELLSEDLNRIGVTFEEDSQESKESTKQPDKDSASKG